MASMDDGAPSPKAGGDGKAVPPSRIDAGALATSSARVVARKATLPVGAAGATEAHAVATAAPGAESDGGRGGEEDDDEQVERFYTLLDNIRAMRGAYMSGSGDGTGALDNGVGTGGGGGGGPRVKRLRGSEPPWRPAFRMEDFEEPAPTSRRAPRGRAGRRPTARAAVERAQTSPQ